MAESLTLRGELRGHTGWVTAIATPNDEESDVLVTCSRCARILRKQRLRLDGVDCQMLDAGT